MKAFELKYGCNPNQKPAWLDMPDGRSLPFEILNGRPGYINFMDAKNVFVLSSEIGRLSFNKDYKRGELIWEEKVERNTISRSINRLIKNLCRCRLSVRVGPRIS